jgi:hypothetical protein
VASPPPKLILQIALMPLSTKILLVLNLALFAGFIGMVLHGHDHGVVAINHHHHHHDHEPIEFDKLLGVEPAAITSIEVRSIERNALLYLSSEGMKLYRGRVTCDDSFVAGELQQIRESADARLFNRWQTFFSMMTPDAQVSEPEQTEFYGLDKPAGCIRIGLLVGNSEVTTELVFGEQNVQELNHYVRRTGDQNIYLIPRYFWQQTVEVVEAGLR